MSQSPEYIHSELPAIQLLQQLGYQYYDASKQDEREAITEVVLKNRLLAAIKRINPWINDNNLNKAFLELTTVNGASLMEINQKIWELLHGGNYVVKQMINGVEVFKPVHFIDYSNPTNNDFLVVNQMKYHGKYQNSIPDLVVYLNGLPISVIECKSPTAQNAWDKAFSDLEYYQKNSEKLFHFNQINAGLWDVGGKYGAINAPQQFYSVFKTSKDDTEILAQAKREQDKLLLALFKKERLLDIIRHFVLFELDEGRTIKKLPRYQQIRATNKTIERLQAGEGGVVWHTQGSGKSLTMAYVTRKLQAQEFGFNNPTVMVMTDRKDLDRQITTTFRNVGLKNVNQASSVVHLDKLLRNDYGGIITTTLQKFQETDKETTATSDQTELEERGNLLIEKHLEDKKLIKIIKELQKGKWVEVERQEIELEELSKKENLYILVDEAHRSHYGFLASFMRTVLPNAKFVAFTGTPISKEDKSTLGEFYGGEYIDVYTITEAVADGATVELYYDEGIAKLDVKKEALDKEFEEKFGDAHEDKKDKLKKEALRKYQLSAERINAIGKHMVNHYSDKIYPDGHKAMIVCSGREAAIKYQQVLHKLKEEGLHNFESKVVVSIGSPKSDAIAKEYYETLEWNKNNPTNKKPVWVVPPEDIKDATDNFKLPFGNENDTEKSGKKQYDNTAFIIVSDMLLTGWDAPITSCLYLDKPLKEHNLLQAIARVNRSKEGKSGGFIVDYNGITAYLVQALEIFSGDIRPDDILKNLNEELPKLAMNHTKLVDFFKPMKIDRNYKRDSYIDAAVRFIEPINKRDDFKALLKDFNKSINIVLPNTKAMKYQGDFKLYNEIKLRAKNAFPDDDELKISKDESKMLQGMIDTHLKAEGVENLLEEPISIIDKEKFKEEIMNASPATKELKMRNNLKHTIKVGMDKNPDFYKPLAQRLDELLKMKKDERITQTEFLIAMTSMQDEIIEEQTEGEAKGFYTEQQRAVYNSMKVLFNEDAEDATKTLFDLIKGELDIVGWQAKGRVQKDIENKIMRFLKIKLERNEAKTKAKEMVDVLIKNKDA
ncbi:type I restriction endonuclease subunit R [Tenacibaculum sp. AHE15PA]|uniref:type I restriction endonuclease n=1 Tax=unclassified Tenacibaculum TaxID=2635139 RepID=UPI001C4EF7C8|nr:MULTISPECIES: type I restriction endonuclease [unclassified Tenacibaculum]QXP72899.1 type I restriction endonuclease subunit R [Tenacibaculum sp. AHE14PA]QXP76813.1 type I restriction endonuclease subunit R [Tenacibaculum sp. AHE15PA]